MIEARTVIERAAERATPSKAGLTLGAQPIAITSCAPVDGTRWAVLLGWAYASAAGTTVPSTLWRKRSTLRYLEVKTADICSLATLVR